MRIRKNDFSILGKVHLKNSGGTTWSIHNAPFGWMLAILVGSLSFAAVAAAGEIPNVDAGQDPPRSSTRDDGPIVTSNSSFTDCGLAQRLARAEGEIEVLNGQLDAYSKLVEQTAYVFKIVGGAIAILIALFTVIGYRSIHQVAESAASKAVDTIMQQNWKEKIEPRIAAMEKRAEDRLADTIRRFENLSRE